MSVKYKFLPETRKYKTNSSIPKESKEYKIFKDYIELEKLLFCENSTKQNLESLKNEIKSIIDRNPQKQKLLIQFLVGILIHFLLIRPKETEIPCNLLSILLLNFSNLNDFILQLIEKNETYENKFIQDILRSQGIIGKMQKSINPLNEKGNLETPAADLHRPPSVCRRAPSADRWGRGTQKPLGRGSAHFAEHPGRLDRDQQCL